MSNTLSSIPLNGRMTVTRSSDGEIRIYIRDELSRVEFVRATMTPEDFTMMITGMSDVEITGTVRGAEVIGKKKITEKRTIIYDGAWDRAAMEKYVESLHEDGWLINSNLGSQGSIVGACGVYHLTYSVYRYE